MSVEHLYREGDSSRAGVLEKLRLLKTVSVLVGSLDTEICFNVELAAPLDAHARQKLHWLLAHPFHPEKLAAQPHLVAQPGRSLVIEIGPRLNFSTAFSSNAVSVCRAAGVPQVTRLEASVRYRVTWTEPGLSVSPTTEQRLAAALTDRMTQCRYATPLDSFCLDGVVAQPWATVPVMERGREALEEANDNLGLAFDDWDLEFYTKMFRERLGRDPTSVECFDLAQSNSEHSRHWFFKGQMIIDGKIQSESLLDMIINTQLDSNQNNVIKFSDNSSAIRGFNVPHFRPRDTAVPSAFETTPRVTQLTFTAETHNFPTGVSPFSGAATGTGGRLRDGQAVGRGGHVIAGTAGYCVGQLLMPEYPQPWEDAALPYPSNLAPPLQILLDASSGASDYGNKFGEPLIQGFVRSFGQSGFGGERREWVKPVMFSGGVGAMHEELAHKLPAEKGMRLVKLGGPAYRIGVGGGAASSVAVQGDAAAELDFGAVQRGDAEMEQKLNRVVRACIERQHNPIASIHDQGAGGNGNVLKELVEPCGAVVFTRAFQLGDPTLSTLELWGAEYQENDAILCNPQDEALLQSLGRRERCPISVVGTVLDSGKMILSEEEDMNAEKYLDGSYEKEGKRHPFDLDLELVLGKMPQKVFRMERRPVIVKALTLPTSLTVSAALQRVLRLPAVASKRYLTNKVDRCVTGLIAQQQCVGPLHTPLADVAVTAISLFSTEGVATAIGEQPIKGLINSAAGARMSVAESLSNLVFAGISDLKDVKCSGNWMWAAKLPGEGAALYDACTAMCAAMRRLGVAVDGGKDSLSMAARVAGETVKAPGLLAVSSYAPCPDVRCVVTPDLKGPAQGREGTLLLVDLSGGQSRLGGSALAQCYRQLGDESPDLDDPEAFARAFGVTQALIKDGAVWAGHDISDGGLIVCLLEMSFAGLAGLEIDIKHRSEALLDVLFAEELGWVLEIPAERASAALQAFAAADVPCYAIGRSKGHGVQSAVEVRVGGIVALSSDVLTQLRVWEETSWRLDARQAAPECVRAEFDGIGRRKPPQYRLTFEPCQPPLPRSVPDNAPRVAVLREEGSNGDREMSAALFKAGFEVWDVATQDLLDGTVTLDKFRGLIFPGGFSYADVLGSAKGWAGSLLLQPELRAQLDAFRDRVDTFSLGVCNGCQLMALLGWVGSPLKVARDTDANSVPAPDAVLAPNLSGRFECRWSAVRIQRNPALMLKGMDGCVLGVWSAHGEGRFSFREPAMLTALEAADCCAVKFVDDDRRPTEEYPFNPNGSPGGLAGVCSADGRHLAMMPHPERCAEMWQWPWAPSDWATRRVSPWQRMFQNAFVWCCDN